MFPPLCILSARAPTGSTNADPPVHWTRRFPDPGARKQLDISYPTNEFVKQVKMWETFESRAMSIVVAHVKGYVVLTRISPVSLMICSCSSSKLPDDVFGPGERPTPPKALKRKKSSKVNISSSFSTAECLAVMQMRWTPGSVF